MKINLKLVTWNCDLTQFLVNANSDKEAIDKSIASNIVIADEFGWETDGYSDEENYSVDEVDFDLLKEIISLRTDFWCIAGDAIVYND